jgi:hypothetical protein
MNLKTAKPALEFAEHVEELTGGLSAAVFVGDDLWVACDELTSVERLTRGGEGFAGNWGARSVLRGPQGPVPRQLASSACSSCSRCSVAVPPGSITPYLIWPP